MGSEIENLKDLLKSRSLKATKGRLDLLQLLHRNSSATSYTEIQKKMAPIDRASLYRILFNLTEHGIIHKAYQENNTTFYALCDNLCESEKHNHKHLHFKCNQCNSVTCEEMPIPFNIKLPKFKIEEWSILLTGLCDKCNVA